MIIRLSNYKLKLEWDGVPIQKMFQVFEIGIRVSVEKVIYRLLGSTIQRNHTQRDNLLCHSIFDLFKEEEVGLVRIEGWEGTQINPRPWKIKKKKKKKRRRRTSETFKGEGSRVH